MKCKINTDIQPLFETSELAKVYYETSALAKGNYAVMPDSGNLIVIKSEWANKGFLLTDKPCIFKDKDGNCKLGKYRPNFCKEVEAEIEKGKDLKLILAEKLNDAVSVPVLKSIKNARGVRRIKAFTKKDLSNIKFDSILYYIDFVFQNVDFEKGKIPMQYEYNYILALIEDKKANRITSIKVYDAVTNDPRLTPIIKVYNRINRSMIAKDKDYQKLLIERLDRLIEGLAKTSIDDNLLEKSKKYLQNKEEANNKIKFTQWLILANLLLTKYEIPYVARYMKELEEHTKLVAFLAIYYLNEALSFDSMELKNENEITFKDLIPRDPIVKEVLEEMEKISNALLKVITK
jgi:Fe-S-cluster containining protein